MTDRIIKTIKAFNASALTFQEKFMDVSSYRDSLDYFIAQIEDGARVVELGCGPGNITKYLYEKNSTLKIRGIDLSEEMIKLAGCNVPQAEFEVKDIRKLDFRAGSCDAIVAAFCFPFIDNSEAAELVKKIAESLKKNGIVYLSTMEGSGSGYEKTSFCKTHDFYFNYYTKDFLQEEFAANNLDLLKLFEQPYSNDDGTVMNDLIYILRKN
ncbi:MAG TPA: class I SAM-dependent methyltransferase [Spirochaetota bacterium]|nr:class I SAM-dependent methyltransferase [Spirochaetota bacterium]HPJ35920.1 class I SAM-dependent methyltransferase [Spirochaetota bacterium]